ncbi:30S ribosomal protein S4e [Candidatus Woesearchaeota archaeon]|nr:MAG: small subunit ribosomal protein S4e [archaeon GW2011_AR18]MBS3161187.1 30S ribosomal protein S4e [Candidatus Woesearchaeota archaeon]HIH25988.1 30S ribosomal protein S4e [Nanoarchaeota archaeon]
MARNHLATIAAPKTLRVERKGGEKWIARARPGAHPLHRSLTLNYILKNVLKHAISTKEVNKILYEKNVTIDKKVRLDHKYGVGLMDIVEIEKLGESYRVLLNNNGELVLRKITKKDSELKILQVVKKTIIKKGKLQLTFHDGRNLLVDKTKLNIGDSVIFDLGKKQVVKEIPLENNSLALLSGGKHIGKLATIKDIIKVKNLEKPKVVVDIDGKEYITLMSYAFAVGKNKPEVSLGEKE